MDYHESIEILGVADKRRIHIQSQNHSRRSWERLGQGGRWEKAFLMVQICGGRMRKSADFSTETMKAKGYGGTPFKYWKGNSVKPNFYTQWKSFQMKGN